VHFLIARIQRTGAPRPRQAVVDFFMAPSEASPQTTETSTAAAPRRWGAVFSGPAPRGVDIS